MVTNLTFNDIPKAVTELYCKLDRIERLLSEKGQTQLAESDEILTVKQCALFLSLAVPTVYSMISRGELPFMKRSKRVYFSKNELIAYLKSGHRTGITGDHVEETMEKGKGGRYD